MNNLARVDKRAYGGILLLAAVALACFLGTLNAPPETEELAYVDYPLIMGTYDTFAQWLLREFVEKMHFIRPVPLLIQGLIVISLQDHTVALRLVNLAALIAIGSLVFRLLLRERVRFPFAWLGGAILIIHPINVMNVVTLIHLGYLLGAIFCLLAISLYGSYRDRPKSAWIWAFEGMIISLMLFSYELYVVSPALLILYEFFIKAKAKLQDVKLQKLLKSLALWTLLVVGNLTIRYFVFRGVGGYSDAWESNPLAPFLKGGKWLSGWGFLHIMGQPAGIGDVITALALTIIFLTLFLRRSNFYLLLFALLWFIAAALPYFVITATYHYVFAFSLVGFIFALTFGLNALGAEGRKSPARILPMLACLLLLATWIYERSPATAAVIEHLKDDAVPAQIFAHHIGKTGDPVMLFIASERSDSHLLVRLPLLLHPQKVEIRSISLPLREGDIQKAAEEDGAIPQRKAYAWRNGRDIAFYPSLNSLLEAARHPPEKVAPTGRRGQP